MTRNGFKQGHRDSTSINGGIEMTRTRTRTLAVYLAVVFNACVVVSLAIAPWRETNACTGITLEAKDGSLIQARTMEWGAFDLRSEVMVTPRGLDLQSITPDGKPGHKWKSKYGVVGLNALRKPIYTDGFNEKGLSVSVLYLPGYAQYQAYDPKQAGKSLDPVDVSMWLLTNFATVDEVREGLPKVRVVPIPMKELGGIPAPLHFLVSDVTGNTIVIEYTKGERHIYDNPVGVLTNAPEFPWHLTNLSNYLGLQPQPWKPVKVGDLDVKPLGAGTGMLGLPGDFSPPSRFVRAVALRNTVRPLATGEDAVLEAFRLLNSFDIPLGAVDAPGKDIMGSTIWTSAMDTKGLRYYYRTQHNSRLRVVDLKAVDLGKDKITYVPLDADKKQDLQMVVVP